MALYVQKKKFIGDNLAAVAQSVPNSTLASSLLSGLSSDYKAFITSVTTRIEPISLDDLIGFRFSQEARSEENSISVILRFANLTIHYSSLSKGQGRFQSGPNHGHIRIHGRGRNNTHDYKDSDGSCSFCQVYNKPSHTVVYCYHRYDPEFKCAHPSPIV